MKNELETLRLQENIAGFTSEQLMWMLKHLGDEDGAVRDELVTALFARGFEEHILTDKQKKQIIQYLIDNNCLFHAINEKSDKVYLRSFTALLLSIILKDDARTRFFNNEQVAYFFKLANTYIFAEKDFRGYDSTNGWGHALAHASDLLVSAMRHPDYELQVAEFFGNLEELILHIQQPLFDNEAKRLGRVLNQAFKMPNLTGNDFIYYCDRIDRVCWQKHQQVKDPQPDYCLDFWIETLNAVFFISDVHDLKEYCDMKVQNYYTNLGYQG